MDEASLCGSGVVCIRWSPLLHPFWRLEKSGSGLLQRLPLKICFIWCTGFWAVYQIQMKGARLWTVVLWVWMSLGTQDHRWLFGIDVATLHLHTSGLHVPVLLSRTPFHYFLSTFFSKSVSNVIAPHLLKKNNSLPLLYPHNDLFILLSSVLCHCLYTCFHL